MSQTKQGVFICPSCKGVVKSSQPLEEGIICGACNHEFGRPEMAAAVKEAPATLAQMPRTAPQAQSSSVMRDLTAKKAERIMPRGVIEQPVVEAKKPNELPPSRGEGGDSRDEEMIMPDGSRKVRRRKKRPKKEKNKGLVLFLLGWLSVIVIVFAIYQMGGKDDEEETPEKVAEMKDVAMKGEILRRFLPAASDSFKRFIYHPTSEGREQFIDNAARMALPFARHYDLHSFPKPESEMKIFGYNVIALSEKDYGIETLWKDENDRKQGALHLWDGKSWKLDWENYAPYSTIPWSRFRSHLGPEKGVFRLLVRKRRTGDEANKFYLSFYRPPGFFEKDDEFRETESPEVEVPTESFLGQKFLKLWDNHLAGKAPFDSILSKALDPGSYMRITAELAWEKGELDKDVIRLKDIRGVAWFGERVQALYRKGQKENEGEENPDAEEDLLEEDRNAALPTEP